MLNVRLAGSHLYGKQLFTWLSLVVSFMASFVLSFFPLDVLDGIWDLIESVSEGLLTYSCDFGSFRTAPTDGLFHYYILDGSIFHFMSPSLILSLVFYFRWKILLANNVDPDQICL